MIKTIIVENEHQHAEYLQTMLEKYFPEIDILKVCTSIPEAILEVNKLQPQLIFLDIELPPYTGFDLLEKTKGQNYKVIFTTAFNKYAVKAIKFCALDYLEKPFDKEELKEAIDKFKNSADSKINIEHLIENVKQQDNTMQKVGIPVLGGYDFIMVADIILCKSDNNYTEFQLINKKKILATKTLKWFEELLHEHGFCRVHDKYLINLNHIVSYKKGGEGGVVELTDKKEVDVSRRKKDEFLEILTMKRMI